MTVVAVSAASTAPTLGVAQDIRRLISPTVGAVLAALTATTVIGSER